MADFFHEEARKQMVQDKIRVIETDTTLTGIEEDSIDLAIFRGAFFFPSLFQVNFSAIHRVLKINGAGFIGGGFGKFTPDHVIEEIGKKSRELNLQIGKLEISEDRLRQDIKIESMEGEMKIISEGGRWVLMRK
jgi:hypothetical protein